MLILQEYIYKLSKQLFFLFIVGLYLALVGYPLVISMLAPPTLSAPQLLMASHTRDRLDVGSHSPRSETLHGAGGGADGAAVWMGGLLCSESKCVAQSSWSSVCRDTEHKVINRNNKQKLSCLVSTVSPFYLPLVFTLPVSAAPSLVSCAQSPPLSDGPAPPASVSSAPLSSPHSAHPPSEWPPTETTQSTLQFY